MNDYLGLDKISTNAYALGQTALNLYYYLNIGTIVLQIAVIMFFYIYASYVYKKSQQKVVKLFVYISIVLIARDALYGLFNLYRIYAETNVSAVLFSFNPYAILIISDMIILTFLLYWLSFSTQEKPGVPLSFFIVNGSIMLVFLGIEIFILNKGLLFLLEWIWLLGNQIYFAVIMNRISEYNSSNADVIIKSRRNILTVLVSSGIIVLILSILKITNVYKPIFISIWLAFSYFVYILIVNRFHQQQDNQRDQEYKFIQKDLDSLFEFMRIMGNAIVDNVEMEKILGFIITSTVKNTNADAGCILIKDEYNDVLKVRAVSGFFPPLYPVPEKVKVKIATLEAYFASTPIRIGETILGEAVKNGEPIFIKNTMNDPRMKQNTHNDTLYVSSIIILPLIINKKVLGVLSVVHRESSKKFTDIDYEHLKTFAEYTSLNINFINTYIELIEKKEIERDIGIAAEIQQNLLPVKMPEIKDAMVAAFTEPAKGVSGDYYDVIPMRGDKTVLAICDVAGKGVSAALVMVMIRSILHLIAGASDKDVATILTWVDRGFASSQIGIDHFATMSLLMYDPASKELTYANAAHHPMLIFRSQDQSVEEIDTEGLPLGIDKPMRYSQKRLSLSSGDLIVLYTDGIIEAMNARGEQYQSDRFKDLIRTVTHLAPKEIVKAIRQDLAQFVGQAKQHDDQTLLLMKVN